MTFHNKEGNPGHPLFDYNGYHLWICLFMLYRLLEHHIVRKITQIGKNFCTCIMKIELLVSDIAEDEKLPEYWNALTGDD